MVQPVLFQKQPSFQIPEGYSGLVNEESLIASRGFSSLTLTKCAKLFLFDFWNWKFDAQKNMSFLIIVWNLCNAFRSLHYEKNNFLNWCRPILRRCLVLNNSVLLNFKANWVVKLLSPSKKNRKCRAVTSFYSVTSTVILLNLVLCSSWFFFCLQRRDACQSIICLAI